MGILKDKISAQRLLKDGFIKVRDNQGVYYSKGSYAIVLNNGLWLPCNRDKGELFNTSIYIETMDQLHQLMDKG